MRRIVLGAVLLGTWGVAAGCRTVGPFSPAALGAANYSFSHGYATQGFATPPATAHPAVVEAMADLGILAIQQERALPSQTVILHGTTADGRHARVEVGPQPAATGTQVSIRIGWFG